MSFCTAVNCIDGRVQLPVTRYLQQRFGVLYVDLVTEPGPARSLAGSADAEIKSSILRRVAVSIEAHGSELIAVVAHADCARNPAGREAKERQLSEAAAVLAESFPGVSILGLWVDERWSVSPVCSLGPDLAGSPSGHR